jgi:transketolase
VVAPADHRQARSAVLETAHLPGPAYFRLGKDDITVVDGLDGRFELGRLQLLRDGADIVLVALGPAALDAVAAADLLADDHVAAAVAVVSSVNPPPVSDLVALFSRRPVAVTVEAHYTNGGLGSLAAETIADAGLDCRLVRCGVESLPDGRTGSQSYLSARYGIDAAQIRERVLTALADVAIRASDGWLAPPIDVQHPGRVAQPLDRAAQTLGETDARTPP